MKRLKNGAKVMHPGSKTLNGFVSESLWVRLCTAKVFYSLLAGGSYA